MTTTNSMTQDFSPPVQQAEEVQRLVSGYTKSQRYMEIAGITAWFTMSLITLVYMGIVYVETPLTLGFLSSAAIPGILAGLLFADFASGFVHWAADNWGEDDWPVLGAAFIRPFRLHHLDEKDIAKHPFLELNGNNCLVSIPVFFLAIYCLDESWLGLFASIFWLASAWWVMGTNQFHAWAHMDHPPQFAKILQKYRIILNTDHHDVHHQFPHHSNYCITNGWLNKPLHMIRFFQTLEWLITKATGVLPKHQSNLAAFKSEQQHQAQPTRNLGKSSTIVSSTQPAQLSL